MTEPLVNSDNSSDIIHVQCSLCLHDVSYEISPTGEKVPWVLCPFCGYKQLTSKLPRKRDLAIFGGTIGVVYLLTVVAVLLVR